MLAILIMLISVIEIIFGTWFSLFFIRTRQRVVKINKEVCLIKKGISYILAEYRISIRSVNKQLKKIKNEEQMKRVLDIVNLVGSLAFIVGMRKKTVCK